MGSRSGTYSQKERHVERNGTGHLLMKLEAAVCNTYFMTIFKNDILNAYT
jgi:hypothetical protein